MKLKKWNIAVIILVFLAVIVYAVFADGPQNLLKLITLTDYRWVAVAALLIVVYWLTEAISLHIVVKPYNKKQRFKDTLTTSMIGQFFNCVTPFASGGQPMQAFHLVKTGVPLGMSSCALMVKFIIYQCVLTVYCALILILKWSFFSGSISGFGYLVFVGFTVNTVIMLFLLSICFFRKTTKKALYGLSSFGKKLRLVKDIDKTHQKIDRELAGFYKGFAQLRTHKLMAVKTVLVTAVQLTAFFSIPYFVCLALSPADSSIISGGVYGNMLSATACVTMISSFVPLPGAAGGAEFSFHTFFSMLLPTNALVSLAMLLWRFITFYLPIVVGMIFTMSFAGGKKGLDEIEKLASETEEKERALEADLFIIKTQDIKDDGNE